MAVGLMDIKGQYAELQDRIEQLQGASSTGEERETALSGEEDSTAQKKT